MRAETMIRRAFVAQGQVQGVGFRPFVYRLAHEGGLSGNVANTSDGVRIEVQGQAPEVARFARRLQTELPPLARLTGLVEESMPPVPQEEAFVILPSHGHSGHRVLVSPDMGICPDCLADIRDPANPRFGYAFTNCTNCGPRYTITRSIPYDRATTCMSCFPLCADCAREYADPLDRRFHAQPIACPQCGPQLWFVDRAAFEAGQTGPRPQEQTEALARAGELLLHGGILALKGLGGFQLVCDARSPQAVQILRQRKHRPHKALALMVGELATARSLCCLRPEHEALLLSPEKPIVLCPRRASTVEAGREAERTPSTGAVGAAVPVADPATVWEAAPAGAASPAADSARAAVCRKSPYSAAYPGAEAASASASDCAVRGAADRAPAPDPAAVIAADVAPDTVTLGIMLPGTPLHALLLDWLTDRCAALGRPAPVLVMTSANVHGEPLCLGNREALERLSPLADGWLLHDRDILVRVDDSVLAVAPRVPAAAEPFFYRRARGYVPRPVALPELDGQDPCIMGTGAELKNTLCLTRGAEAFVSQHIGDLQNVATGNFFEEVAAHLQALLEVRPSALVCDLHPDFFSTHYAAARARQEGLPLWHLQHHAAHAASVLAENSCYEPALCLCFDGTGLGTDGSIWGGELLFMDLGRAVWQRLGRLSLFSLPGGEAAIRQPWRTALALGLQAVGPGAAGAEQDRVLAAWQAQVGVGARAVAEMLARQCHCPQTSSCGRLFDAVAAQLGLCREISYEGQAAIRLEKAALEYPEVPEALRPWEIALQQRGDVLELDSSLIFAHVLQAQQEGQAVARTAAVFHRTLAHSFAQMALQQARRSGLRQVGLSGGVLQNSILARLLPQQLTELGLRPLVHHELPPGDGCIALGQAVWGRQCLHLGRAGEQEA